MAHPSLAQQERQTLCDLMIDAVPDAPTLCEGWRTADLAAHLVVRERRPDSGPDSCGPRSPATRSESGNAVRDRTPWAKLVDIRAGRRCSSDRSMSR